MFDRFRSADPFHLWLFVIVAIGVFLRAYGLNWDDGLYLHPDERFIAIVSSSRIDLPPVDDLSSLFDAQTSPINPRRDDPATGAPMSFAYGSLPIYVQSIAAWGVNLVSATDYQSYPHIYKVGRVINVLLDSLTIVLVFLIGRRLFRPSAGVVAAALYALAVLPIQLSHFFTVDIWLTFFVTAALYLAIRFVDEPSLDRALVLALPVGCAFATKASVPSLVVPLAVMAGWVIWQSEDRLQAASRLLGSGALAVAVFTLFEPYAIVNRGPFIEDIRTQARIVRGEFDVPFTRQFVGLTPGLYELRNHFLYALGPALVIAGLAGVGYGLRRAWRWRDPGLVIALSWIVAYLPTLLITEARFLRYSLPLLPIVVALAGGLLTTRVRIERRIYLRVATASVLIVTAVWAFGFVSIYSREHPRVAASEWITTNIPAGSRLGSESWDDVLPLPLSESPPTNYTFVEFKIYDDAPPEEKAAYLAQQLIQSDYVILSSDRVIDSVDNLPWRYAVQNEYYRRLLNGQLGFQLVYQAELRPELFGVRYDDSNADESFTVYDHPRVRIFKKVETLDQAQIRERLLWGIQQPWEPQRYPAQQPLMLGTPVEDVESTRDAGWNNLAVDHPLIAIMVWLLAVETLGLAVLPLAAAILPLTPDRGAFSARLLGLILVGWIGWFAGSLGFWQSRSLNIALTLVIVAGACWGVARWRRRRGMALTLPDVRQFAASFGVWIGLFGFFLFLRALYPDFWQTWFGGEKPFELAYLRAIAASVGFPPYDPWYADGVINYYYYGWHLLATIIKLSGVGVSHGFQLGSATFAAFLGLQVASLGAMLFRRGRFRIPARPVAIASAAAVVGMLFIGNLDPLLQVNDILRERRDVFDFWQSTRVVEYSINEFPYFSEVWADVHPHVLNFPIVALLLTLLAHLVLNGSWRGVRETLPSAAVIALIVGTVAVTNSWDAPLMVLMTFAAFGYVGLLRGWRAGLVAVGVGALTVAASFALYLPFYRGFYSVVQGLKQASAGSALDEFLTHWGIFFGIVLVVIIVECARRLPANDVLRDGLAFAVVALVGGTFAEGLALLRGDGLPDQEGVIAILIAAAISGLAGGATRTMRQPAMFVGPLTALVALAGIVALHRPAASVALGVTAAAVMFVVQYRRLPSRLLPWSFVAIGAVTIAATEFVYVADDLQNSDWERMNTVFKFYLQSWMLLAIGSVVLLARLWRDARFGDRSPISSPLGIVAGSATRTASASTATRRATLLRQGSAIVTAVLLAAGLLYPVLGTPVRLDQNMESSPSGLSLDGYAWMAGGSILNGTNEPIEFTGDLAAIRWLNENTTGTPVILEASIGPYRGNGGRISSATGLPAVLGWDRHQRQQRYEPGISARMEDVRAIYNETEPGRKLEMLRRYRVRYVIVGDVERYWNFPENPTHYASVEGLDAFERLLGQGLRLAFESAGTRIYEVVDFPRLPPREGAVYAL